MDSDRALGIGLVVGALLVLVFGVILIVDGAIHLAASPLRVHIVSTHNEVRQAPQPQGGSIPYVATVGRGYYVDSSGKRHWIVVDDGEDLKPGTVTDVRQSAVGPLGWQVRSRWIAGDEILVGLAFIGGLVFVAWKVVFDP